MPILIVEHSGSRKTIPLTGRVWIGRDATLCQIVIDHPIVSRQHAFVELNGGGAAVVTDNGSRNGTLIAGEKLGGPTKLRDGDIFKIGPATIAFHATDPELEIEAPSVDAGEVAGIIFKCECGARLWAPRGASGASTLCPQCRRRVRCPGGDGTPPPPTRQDICSVCQWKIQPHEPTVQCPACGLFYHSDCWKDNKGCAAYGCSQVNVLVPPEDAPRPDVAPQIDPDLQELAEEIEPRAVEIPLLAAAVIASLLGIVAYGVPAGIVCVIAACYMLVRRGRSRMLLAGATLVALIGTVAGVLASLYFWMQIPPGRLFGT